MCTLFKIFLNFFVLNSFYLFPGQPFFRTQISNLGLKGFEFGSLLDSDFTIFPISDGARVNYNRFCLKLREAAKKVILCVARPPRGRGEVKSEPLRKKNF